MPKITDWCTETSTDIRTEKVLKLTSTLKIGITGMKTRIYCFSCQSDIWIEQ